MKTYIVIISINPENYHWYIPRYIHVGEKLYLYPGVTYGCISPSGIALIFEYNKNPFFEVPRSHVKESV